MTAPNTKEVALQKVMQSVTIEESGCWVSSMSPGKRYPMICCMGKNQQVSRFMYQLHTGLSIPPKLCVCHSCDNPRCVNPTHLWLGTYRENLVDCLDKGRHNTAVLTAENVIDIRARLAKGELRKPLAEEYGVCESTISHVRTGRIWGNSLGEQI